jgi:hypothetical protein
MTPSVITTIYIDRSARTADEARANVTAILRPYRIILGITARSRGFFRRYYEVTVTHTYRAEAAIIARETGVPVADVVLI